MSASTASTAAPAQGAYQRLAGWHGELTAFRRDLHAHPELGFEEKRTAARVVPRPCAWPASTKCTTGVGRTGVVGIVRGGPAHRRANRRAR